MERRPVGDGMHALVSTDMENRGFLAAWTERGGGVSEGPYASLNVAFHTGDRARYVRTNRRLAIQALGVPPFAVGRQVHGARVIRVGAKRAGLGFEAPESVIPRADALAVSTPGLPVGILAADCLALCLVAPAEGVVVAVHAGWRGLAAGILDRALAALPGTRGALAAMGPAIGPCHYEVGEDVALAVAAGTESGAVTERRGGRLYLDLPGTAARRFRAAGIRNMEDAAVCTACQGRRFFSYRRDGTTGRMAMIAMRL